MSKIEAHGSKSRDSSDWNRAWESVARLAAARNAALPRVETARPATDESKIAPAVAAAPTASLSAADSFLPPMARDQLARDIAAIEKAAAALRRAEASVEPRLSHIRARTKLRGVRSVWILIALIWLSAASAVSCAIGVIFLLFG